MSELPTLVHIDIDLYAALLLKREIESWSCVRHVGVASTIHRGREMISRERPNIILLDADMPDSGGFKLIEELTLDRQSSRVIIFTASASDLLLYLASKIPIGGIVWKTQNSLEHLAKAIQNALQGKRYVPVDVSCAIRRFRSNPNAFYKILSQRELALLPKLGRGLTDIEIAAQVGMKPGTVHSHRQRIMSKLDLHSRGGLMRWCQAAGFVSACRIAAPCSDRAPADMEES
jgi:DNA-binding NarL/FixJ family response regulator